MLWHRVCLHLRSWRSLSSPALTGRQFIAWRRQPQGIPNEPTIILSPQGGGRGNSRQGRRWCRVARADRDSQVSALGVGLRAGAPFRCTHRIPHRKRGPLSTRTLRCTLPFQLSMALVALRLWWLRLYPRPLWLPETMRGAVCMILMIFLEARPRAGAIKATPATDLMVFPAVPDHSRPQVRLALSCRPRLGFGSRGLVVRSLRHLPWGLCRQAMKFRRSAAGKSRCRTPLPSRGQTVTRMAGVLNHARSRHP